MGRSNRRKKRKTHNRVILLVILLILLAIIINNTFAKYSSSGLSDAAVDVAFFLIKEEKISESLALTDMVPGTSNSYTFSIANYDDSGEEVKVAQVSIEYELKIRTTTNLPLIYELYQNGELQNLFGTATAEQDEDGTYFKKLTLAKEYFDYGDEKKNTYELKVSFPAEYNMSNYQGIMEAVEISINALQRR